jgi:hypothetical protein
MGRVATTISSKEEPGSVEEEAESDGLVRWQGSLGGVQGWRHEAQIQARLVWAAGFLLFLFFILLTEAGIQNASEKGPIYRALWSEAFWMPTSVQKCLPRLKLL